MIKMTLCVTELGNKTISTHTHIHTQNTDTKVRYSEGLVTSKAHLIQRIHELLGTYLAVHSLWFFFTSV